MKKTIIFLTVLILSNMAWGVIGTGDLSTDAKKGFAWHFLGDHTKNWAEYEAAIIIYWEAQGVEWNKQRLESIANKVTVADIRERQRKATDAQLALILAYLISLGL